MKRHEPDPESTAIALSRRLDGLEQKLGRLDTLEENLSAIGRGLGELTHQVSVLADTATRRIFERPNRPADAKTGSGGDATGEQPDWLTVTDPALAAQWLTGAADFATDVLPVLCRIALPACWLLHPAAVAEVIAAQLQHRNAFLTNDPTPVSELFSRWLPGTARRLMAETGACSADRAHRTSGHSYEIRSLDPVRVAMWWAETHGARPDAVEAFALTRLT